MLALAAQDINRRGAVPKLRRFLELAMARGPANFGIIVHGNGLTCDARELISRLSEATVVHAAYSSSARVEELLQDLKREDLGLSVVVSGPLDDARRLAAAAGLTLHTVSLSLGIWGNTRSLPGRATLEVTSLCGHGLVSPGLVEKMADEVRLGRLTPAEAGKKLAGPCVCGIFNPEVAAEAVRRMTAPQHPDGAF